MDISALYCLSHTGLIRLLTLGRLHGKKNITSASHASLKQALTGAHSNHNTCVCAQTEGWCPLTFRWPGPTAPPWRSRSYCPCWRTWPRCFSHIEEAGAACQFTNTICSDSPRLDFIAVLMEKHSSRGRCSGSQSSFGAITLPAV